MRRVQALERNEKTPPQETASAQLAVSAFVIPTLQMAAASRF